MKEKFFRSVGMSLLSIPAGKKDCVNEKKRGVRDLESVSAAELISTSGLKPNCPTIVCGAYNKSVHLLHQLLRMSRTHFVLVGSDRDLNEFPIGFEECWEYNNPVRRLPDSSGVLKLLPNAETMLELKICLPDWDKHMVVFCAGKGLQLDLELMDLLYAHGNFMLLTDSLFRGIKSSDGTKLSPADVLSGMDYIVISSIGTAAKDLIAVLPTYESEKITNTGDISLFSRTPHSHTNPKRRLRGGSGNSISLSQSRTIETKPIFSHGDLNMMQAENVTILYNVREGHLYTARLIR